MGESAQDAELKIDIPKAVGILSRLEEARRHGRTVSAALIEAFRATDRALALGQLTAD